MNEPDNFFVNQRELGKLFGKSSHVIGRWLFAIGLRKPDGRPSSAAFDGGFVQKADTGRNNGYYYKWHREKTLKALMKAGHQPVVPVGIANKPVADRLVGPFSINPNGGDGYEIVGGDGFTVAWVRGELNATKFKWLLNLAHKYGKMN